MAGFSLNCGISAQTSRSARLFRGFSQGRLARECQFVPGPGLALRIGPPPAGARPVHAAGPRPTSRSSGSSAGRDRPRAELKDLAVELRMLGAVDLWVADAAVPGAARSPEEVIALAVAGPNRTRGSSSARHCCPGTRSTPRSCADGIGPGATHRLAWLADVAVLAIDRRKGFPGGCRRDPLERFLKAVGSPPAGADWDDLGRPGEGTPTSPIWRRWKINYGGTTADLERRAAELFAVPRRRAEDVARPRTSPATARPRRSD